MMSRYFKMFTLVVVSIVIILATTSTLSTGDTLKTVQYDNIINMTKAETMVRSNFGKMNDINTIIKDLKYILGRYEKNSKLKRCVVDNVLYTENSYMFLLMSSIAYKESRFNRHAVGGVGELSAYQIRPGTAMYLVDKFNLNWDSINIEDELLNNRKATFLALRYIKSFLKTPENIIYATSRYNGDSSGKYGRSISKIFNNIIGDSDENS